MKKLKEYKLTVRASEEEYKIIKLKAEASGMSMSRYLVKRGVDAYVPNFEKSKKQKEREELTLRQIEGQIEIG